MEKRENTMTDVTVSIVVPCYNHKHFLKQRLDSIFQQTYTDFEVILLDDCSTDGSQELLQSYKDNPRVSHVELNEVNTGSPFAQWEKGIKLARGKYIWIAESDDYADVHFLEYTVAEMERHPEATLCYTGSFLVDAEGKGLSEDLDVWAEEGETLVYESCDYLRNRMVVTNSTYNASMILFRKADCLTDINPAYSKMRYCGDWLFWIDQIRKGKTVLEVRRKLNFFRQHSAGTTIKSHTNYASLSEVLFILDYLCQLSVVSEYEKIIRLEDVYWFVRYNFVGTKERREEIINVILPQYGLTPLNHVVGSVLCMKTYYDKTWALLKEVDSVKSKRTLNKHMRQVLSTFNNYVNVAGFWKNWRLTYELRKGLMNVLVNHESELSAYVAKRIRKINSQWPLFYWIHWGRKSFFKL